MNINKIAALYAQASPGGRLCLPLAQLALRNRRQLSADGYTHRFDASCLSQRGTYRDALGDRCSGFIDEYGPKRVADWIKQQMPGYPEEILNINKEVTGDDQYLVSVWGYAGDNPNLKTTCMLRYGALSDFNIVLRGMAAYQRKQRKQQQKTIAQLLAYHQQQVAAAQAKELESLRCGKWMGAEKAITTAARIDEPGMPFMGDTSLTLDQCEALGMGYYAVHEHMNQMPSAFPVGTGFAIKPVKRSRELVDGAVYFWRWIVNGKVACQFLGRLDLSAKERGHLPLRFEDGSMPHYCWAAYGENGAKQGIQIYRITHYTTRNGAVMMQAETQPVQQAATKGLAKKVRELAHAA